MAVKKTKNTNDERKARGRFMDQPGQWHDVTPKSVKKRNQKEWDKLARSMQAAKKR